MLLVFLLLAERISRTLGPVTPGWRAHDKGAVVMVGHPTRLWGMAPGVRQNGETTATVDARGLRAPVPEGPRVAGRERILVLGDSTFFGHGVPDDQTLPVHLERRLRADGVDVDVVNGGVPGYSTEQTRLLLDELGFGLDPSLLVIGNLWSDNNYDHFADADLLLTRDRYADNPLARSAFFVLVTGALDRLRGGRGAHVVTWTTRSEWPEEGVRRVPVQRYAENLDAIAREAAARDVGVVFLAPLNRSMAEGASDGGASWQVYYDAQEAVAAHHGVPVVRARSAMIAAAKLAGAASLFVDVMHPSASGHAVLANATADALREAGWPTTRLLATGAPFDDSGLTDAAPSGGTDEERSPSPQANLFPSEPPPPLPTTAALTTHAAGSWVLAGTVTGASGPVRVEVKAKSGETLSLASLPGPGPFEIGVRADKTIVDVIATSAGGGSVAREVRQGDAAIALALPGGP